VSRLQLWQESLTAVLDGSVPSSRLAGLSLDGAAVGYAEGAQVYRRSSRAARVAALQAAYPVCGRLLGDTCFAALARDYVGASPSPSGDLNRYGGGFAGFVRARVVALPAFGRLPWLADLAGLEWQVHRLACRGSDAQLVAGPVSPRDPACVKVRCVGHVRLLRSRWPVHRIWRMHQPGEQPVPLDPADGRCWLLVDGGHASPRVRSLPARLWLLLDACRDHARLDVLAARPELPVARLGHLLARGWIEVREGASGPV
jgi:hypothetical protein